MPAHPSSVRSASGRLFTAKYAGLRPSGLFGGMHPFVVHMADLEYVGVTQQDTVRRRFTGEYNRPGLWNVQVGGEGAADRWFDRIQGIIERRARGPEGVGPAENRR